jgi:hypothetical protein
MEYAAGGPWTPREEDTVVIFIQRKMLDPSLTWQDCADFVNSSLGLIGDDQRSLNACRLRWNCHLKRKYPELQWTEVKCESPHRYVWTLERDILLGELITKHSSPLNWETIAKRIGDGVSSSQCRERYHKVFLRYEGSSFDYFLPSSR